MNEEVNIVHLLVLWDKSVTCTPHSTPTMQSCQLPTGNLSMALRRARFMRCCVVKKRPPPRLCGIQRLLKPCRTSGRARVVFRLCAAVPVRYCAALLPASITHVHIRVWDTRVQGGHPPIRGDVLAGPTAMPLSAGRQDSFDFNLVALYLGDISSGQLFIEKEYKNKLKYILMFRLTS